MEKFIIYRDSAGSVFAQRTGTKPEAEISKKLTEMGYTVLRPYAIAAVSQDEAVSKFQKASKLREEGAKIGEKVSSPQAIAQLQRETEQRDEGVRTANRYQEAMMRSQRLGDGSKREPTVYSRKDVDQGSPTDIDQLHQIGTGAQKFYGSLLPLAKDLVNRYYVGDTSVDPVQNFADNIILPYDNEIARDVVEDPTLVPSMFIPGVGEARVAQTIGKASRYVPKLKSFVEPTAKAVTPAVNTAVQTQAASLAPGDQDEGTSMLAGTALGHAGRAVGSVLTKNGEKRPRNLHNKIVKVN